MQTTINHPVREVWTKAGPIEAVAADTAELRRVEEVHQAQIGDATPMGLFGFATGTLVIGFVLSGLVPLTGLPAVIPSVLVFAGVAQFIAGLYAFSKGNTFAGTAMCSFGANNVLVTSFIWMQSLGLIPKGHSEDILLGVGLCCLGYIALALAIAGLNVNGAIVATLLALVPGYALPGIRYFGAPPAIGHIGGGFLLLAALLAFYVAGAMVINSTHERQVLGLGRLHHER
ncbi:MAG: acetate uptake transporter [Vulcanimicrobiaceae bacterium]